MESLIEHRASIEGPGTTSPEGLLRLSIGLENADDLSRTSIRPWSDKAGRLLHGALFLFFR